MTDDVSTLFLLFLVIELHKIGKTNREVGRVTGIPEKRVSALVRKWRREGCKGVPLHKHGGGPTKKVSDNTLSVIRWELNKNPSITAKQLKEQNPLLLRNVSICTVQRNIQKKLN